MKKFLLNVFAYIVIICVITSIINAMYVKLDTRAGGETTKFETIPDNIEICNVGSSHGRDGYNYTGLEDEYVCFNFALSSQSLSYDYRILDYYQDKLKEQCIVFINISYFSLIGKGEENEEDFESKNKRYYSILDGKHIKQYDYKTAFIVKYMPVLDARLDLFRVLFTRPHDLVQTDIKMETESDTVLDEESIMRLHTAEDIDLQAYVEAAYKRHLIKNKLDQNGKIIIDEDEVTALYSLIDLCNQNGWTPILVTTPFLSEYTEYVSLNSPEFLDLFYGLIEEVVRNSGVVYYDYSLDERFSTHHELFANGDHLNEAGAKMFVNIIEKEIIDRIGFK